MKTKSQTKKITAGKAHTFQKSEKQSYSRPTFVTTENSLEQLDMNYWVTTGLTRSTPLKKEPS